MKHLAILHGLLALLVAYLVACSDSEDYLFSEQDSKNVQNIQVNAYITASFDSSSLRAKSDTIQPKDSVIFLTTITPSKAIRTQKYFWTIDDSVFAREYSFRRSIPKPGFHEVAFFLVDYYGDTVSDTISLYVGTPPVLDNENFIPARGSENFEPSEFVNFAWNCNDPDSLWDISYHFTIKEAFANSDGSENVLVDTILRQPFFTHLKGFSPLTKYEWSVTATNELRQTSYQSIRGDFFVAGLKEESAILGALQNSSGSQIQSYHLILKNQKDSTVYENANVRTSHSSSMFKMQALKAGDYTLYASIDSFPDFKVDTLSIHLNKKQVLELDTIKLVDETEPYIRTLEGDADTVAMADTLKFSIIDFGGKIQLSKTSVRLEENIIQNISLAGDTLVVPMGNATSSWTYRILTVISIDLSGNKAKRSFYVKPNKTFEGGSL